MNMRLIFVTEILQGCQHRVGGTLSQTAEAGAFHQIAEVFQCRQILRRGSIACYFAEDIIENAKKDIYSVIALSKVDKPTRITLIIAEQWKYELYSRVMSISKKNTSRNVSLVSKELMASDLKKNGQEIMKILPKIMDKLPSFVLWQEEEYNSFSDERQALEKEFGCLVDIVKESDSKETKAKNAMPGKPAIIVQ